MLARDYSVCVCNTSMRRGCCANMHTSIFSGLAVRARSALARFATLDAHTKTLSGGGGGEAKRLAVLFFSLFSADPKSQTCLILTAHAITGVHSSAGAGIMNSNQRQNWAQWRVQG